MTAPVRIELERVPSLARGFGRMLLTRKRGLAPGATVPVIEAHLPHARIDRQQLRAYCDLCRFSRNDRAPITFPQILATSVAIELLLADGFPFSPLGIVHIGSTMREQRPLTPVDDLDVTCRVDGHRDVRQGKLLSLETTIEVDGVALWHSSNEVLVREGKPRRERRRPREPVPPAESARTTMWQVPAAQGRRYARVSGDYNPIHLSALSARLFGFPSAIAHGLWTLARSVAEIGDAMPEHPFVVEAEFKRPLLLPSRVRFACVGEDAGVSWEVRSDDGSVPHVIGRVRQDRLVLSCPP